MNTKPLAAFIILLGFAIMARHTVLVNLLASSVAGETFWDLTLHLIGGLAMGGGGLLLKYQCRKT